MPQDWTDRNDREKGPSLLEPVPDTEEVAARVSKDMCPSHNEVTGISLSTDLLVRPNKPSEINNTCGVRTGQPVYRKQNRTIADLVRESRAEHGADSAGVIVASVREIRALRGPDPKSPREFLQAFYVYEDPNAQHPHKAVIRYNDALNRSQKRLRRDELLDLFKHHI